MISTLTQDIVKKINLAAFCFYNLSSIVNGLVYFDQFSLIPPVHLGLVILGIFVLLGGVWVVSIQHGGGGVDVGTWNQGNDFSCEESVLLPDPEDLGDGIREAATVSMAEQPGYKTTNHRHIGPVAMERETLSESNISNMVISPQTSVSEMDDPARDASLAPILTTECRRPRRAYTHLCTGPQDLSPHSLRNSMHRGLTTDLQSPTSIQSGHSRTASHPHPMYSQASHLPPLGPVSTLGTGFQIGLSPSSPGFTIVPLDRRRTSGLGTAGRGSLADVANDIIIGLREAERRRAVSEGGLTRRRLNEVQDVSRNDGAAAEEEHTERHGDDGIDETRTRADEPQARRRWRWIRKVFTGRNIIDSLIN